MSDQTGGTIATGGVALQVQQSETALGGNHVRRMLGKHLNLTPEEAQERLLEDASKMKADDFVRQVKKWLLSAFYSHQEQAGGFGVKVEEEKPKTPDAAPVAPAQPPPAQLNAPAPVNAPAEEILPKQGGGKKKKLV